MTKDTTPGQEAAAEGALAARGWTPTEIRRTMRKPDRLAPTPAGRRFAEQMLAAARAYEQERRAEIIARGGDPDEDRDSFEAVRAIADDWAATADDPDGRAALLDHLADSLDTSEVRALRLAAEAATAITPRLIRHDADHGVSAAQTAEDLGMTESYVYRIRRTRPATGQ
ncbi:hypothetical protein QEN61_gp56 [Streptomyces phage Eklok]|uniref:Helix-turn-helix DNA binding domain protein n=1 Tax=Streptomyces phage Eklok TaxID=2743999 RepID=A0A7D5KSU7_9CAUD|nr:hypothetical protein QEN61_gp56 [Streptomyces phage Eklok]QLF83240.1 hypothetical protein SEA_EKLOK_56 [Streptomyces phage Eklok]